MGTTGILWVKSFHIISMTCWMAGLFYLPRLFVYHAISAQEKDQSSMARLRVMERKLFRFMIPFVLLTLGTGLWLMTAYGSVFWRAGWLHTKLLLVLFLLGYYWICGRYVQQLSREENSVPSDRFFRWFNEISILPFMAIVLLVVLKPF